VAVEEADGTHSEEGDDLVDFDGEIIGKPQDAADAACITKRSSSAHRIRSSRAWQDKAGAYAIQETEDAFVERIGGSVTNVMGLPLELLDRLLDELPSNS